MRDAARALIRRDRDAGALGPRERYAALFPGFEDVVSAEYPCPATEGGDRTPTITSGAPPTDAPTRHGAPRDAAPHGGGPGAPGETLGPYVILRELGRGGMGVVYEARDTRLPRRVALKVLPTHFASSAHLRLRFQREAELASRLDHPNICTVYEAAEANGVPFMAMRYVEGRPLSELIASTRAANPEGARTTGVVRLGGADPLEPATATGRSASAEAREETDRVLVAVETVARALHVAHECGLVHRDVKPHNVMVTAGGVPVLLDFGLAREEHGEGADLTQTGSLMGTPAYMSPEQLTAHRIRLDRRTDVYSLGVTLYECLTLRLPFEAPTTEGLYQKILATEPDSPRRWNPALHPDLAVVVATAMEKDRDRRYQTALDLAEDLRRVRERKPIRARPAGPLLRLGRWAQRNPALATAVGSLLAVLASALVVTVSLLRSTYRDRASLEIALGILRVEETRAMDAYRNVKARQEETARALRESRSLALASASAEAARVDPTLAFLLARDAVREDPTPEAVSRLHAAMAAPLQRADAPRGWRPAAATPDGSRVVGLHVDGSVRVLDGDGVEVGVFRPEDSPIRRVALSADGSRVVTLGAALRTGCTDGSGVATLGVPPRNHVLCAISPSGDAVVTVEDTWRGSPALWQVGVPSPRPLALEAGRPGSVSYLDGGARILVTSDAGGEGRLFDRRGEPIRTLTDPELPGRVRGSPGGLLFSGAKGDRVQVFRSDGTALPVILGVEHATVVGFDSRGQRLVVASRRATPRGLLLCDPEAGSIVWISPESSAGDIHCGAIAFDGATGRVVSTWSDDRVRIHAASGALVGSRFLPGSRDAFLLPGGRRAVVPRGDGAEGIWDLDAVGLPPLISDGAPVTCLAMADDGARLATVSADGRLRVWASDGTLHPRLDGAARDQAVWAGFLPDGALVTADPGGRLHWWSAEGIETRSIDGLRETPRLVAASPRGDRFLLAPGRGPPVIVSDAGELLATLRGHEDVVSAAAFGSTGDIVATGSLDGWVRVWSTDGRLLRRHATAGRGVFSLAAVGDGGEVVVGLADGSIARAAAGDASVRDIAVRTSPCRLSRSPDGDLTAILMRDGSVEILGYTREGTLRLAPHDAAVTAAAWTADGRVLATASADGVVRRTHVPVADLLASADARTTRPLRIHERRARTRGLAGIDDLEDRRVLRVHDDLERWFAAPVTRAEVIDALTAWTLPPSVFPPDAQPDRSDAEEFLRQAREWDRNPEQIVARAHEVVTQPGRREEDYRAALRLAEEALGLRPFTPAPRIVAAAARLRLGEVEASLSATTALLGSLPAAEEYPERHRDLVLLRAMRTIALRVLGRRDEAAEEAGALSRLIDGTAGDSLDPALRRLVGDALGAEGDGGGAGPAAGPDAEVAERRIAENEARAIAALRELARAQEAVRAAALIDADGDGRGEFGTLLELSGRVGVRTRTPAGADGAAPASSFATPGRRLDPPALAAGWWGNVDASGFVVRDGYAFMLFLPDAAAIPQFVHEMNLGGVAATSAPVGIDASEIAWCAYAQPIAHGRSGWRRFFVSHAGEVLQSWNDGTRFQGCATAIAGDSACSGIGFPGLASPIAVNVPGNDGDVWRVLR